MTFQEHGSVRGKNGTRFEYNIVFNDCWCLNKGTSPKMSCPGRTAHHPSWHIVHEVGKRVIKFQANFTEVFEVLYLSDGSNYIQIRLQVFQPCH